MKGQLPIVFPFIQKLRIPVTRDSAMILFVALNELVMGLETYLAHVMNGTIRIYEWIPIMGGPLIAMMLIGSVIIAKRNTKLALIITAIALTCSIVIGLLGTYFHLIRAMRPLAASGERFSLSLLVWGAPVFAPPTFILVGVLGFIAISNSEGRKEGGALGKVLIKNLPFLKDKIYFVLVSFGVLIATVSSLFDHMRGGFSNPWLWVPTISGILGMITALMLALLNKPHRGDLAIYTGLMGLLLLVGPLGLIHHILFDLGPGGLAIIERFLRGAPVLAPMVFANMGLLGLLVLLDPE